MKPYLKKDPDMSACHRFLQELSLRPAQARSCASARRTNHVPCSFSFSFSFSFGGGRCGSGFGRKAYRT